jgi:hypothetical protein
MIEGIDQAQLVAIIHQAHRAAIVELGYTLQEDHGAVSFPAWVAFKARFPS